MLDFAHRQHCSDRRRLLLLALLLIVAAVVSLCAGDRWLGPESWLGPDGQLFVWQIRLPRTLAVILVGAALALCGTIMQALFENPLAEPRAAWRVEWGWRGADCGCHAGGRGTLSVEH